MKPTRWSLLVSIVLAGALALAVLPASSQAPTVALQTTADMSQWRAGNIISDAIFFSGTTWAPSDVAYFIQKTNPNCVTAPDGTPCLRDFWENTPNRAADAYCSAYTGAAGESAATIIAKVGRACGINQRVLLVMLQKEQGLVTGSGKSLNGAHYAWERYEKAMGFKCPDTAPCDPTYGGFFNQVYYAARQYKIYAANPNGYGYHANASNNIRYNPNAACGASSVYIENQATAGLYNYTPYQPNAAALAAGRGTGDACSAYGNRNFWGYFTDWFGSTQSPGPDQIVLAHIATGGDTGPLGPATTAIACGFVRDGCGEQFQRGSIYWSPATGAHPTSGAIRDLWMATGWERGPLGYATSDITCGLTRDGCSQWFENSVVMWSPATGARFTNGRIGAAWLAAGAESGALGYPSSDMACGMAQSGCGQQFEGGSVYYTIATDAHPVLNGPIRDYWIAQGWEQGSLGYAASDQVCTADGTACRQDFQGQTVAWSQAAGAQTTSGSIRDLWVKQGAGGGALGSPKSAMVCGLAGGACRQEFTGGVVFATATAIRVVPGAIGAAWLAGGAEAGSLGAPSADAVCNSAGTVCRQDFARETAAWTAATGVQTTSGSIRDVWVKQGAGGGALGSPKSAMVCGLAGGACRQEFSGGAVFATASTTRVVPGAMGAAWLAGGAEAGSLGAPTADAVCNSASTVCRQDFARETMSWTPATGVQTTSGAVRAVWLREGAGTGWLGAPTAAMVCGLAADGCKQDFQGGPIYWSVATGARATNGSIAARWVGEGAESGYLGYPSTDMGCGMVRSGCGQQFQGGSIYASPATGAQATSGAIRSYWMAQGWERGALGYPAGPMTCAEPDGGCRQQFEGGTVVWSPIGNRVTVLH